MTGLVICLLLVHPGGDIVTERVFGPEIPGKYKHPASITELQNGNLYLVYYGGAGEYSDDATVHGARRRKGESRWSAPKTIQPQPKFPEGNAVVWQAPGRVEVFPGTPSGTEPKGCPAPDGVVWLFSVTRHGATWSTSRIVARTSTDGAETWTQPVELTTEAGTMVRGRPIVLADGDYLLPIYHETGHDPERVGADTTSLFLRYDVKHKRWTESNRITSRLGNLQPAVVALNAKDLICYCRRGADYAPRSDGYLVRSESHDGGRTWSPGLDSRFPNPNAAVDFLRLANGHLLLVYNDSMNHRTPLTAAISIDDDKTYPYRRNLAEGPGDFGYPYAIQTRDGKIHVIYTSNHRSVINHAVFDESAILGSAKKP
jgi:predicted neuraminidase